jgi:hypothetical protein
MSRTPGSKDNGSGRRLDPKILEVAGDNVSTFLSKSYGIFEKGHKKPQTRDLNNIGIYSERIYEKTENQ